MRPVLVVTLLLAACAGGGGTAPAPVLALFAGDMRGVGAVDGTGTTARFNVPVAVATDRTGNVYVAEHSSHTIRKITPAGVVTTLAGAVGLPGSVDGTGAAARFNEPAGVAADSAGNVYVTDRANHTIRKITPAGAVTTLAGRARVRGYADGAGAAACFDDPRGIAADGAGNVYVADSGNNTIRKIRPDGVVTTLAGTARAKGSTDGTGPAARFEFLEGLATDSAGNVFVGDASNGTIRKITPAGEVTTLAGTAGVKGSTDGAGAAARFNGPVGVVTDSAGNVYVADDVDQTIRKITPAGVVTTLAGTAGATGYSDGTGAAARFFGLGGLAADSAGNVYVADLFNYAIRRITPAGMVTTFAGTGRVRGSTDGTGAAARFSEPRGIAADRTGNVYVADMFNHTIRKITPGGLVSTLAGTAGVEGSTDATGTAARFTQPDRVATDAAGNIYVSEKSTIRKITPAGVVTTLAGTAGDTGSVDGTGAAARFGGAAGVAADSAGNVYVADLGNNTIRKITPAGVVTTLAGTAGVRGSTDGTGAAARFDLPFDVATDSAGNIYVADFDNKTIRKITPAGEVTTLAGTPGVSGSTDGAGAAARFNQPEGLAVDSAGNVYVADRSSHTIRKITPAGVVSTIVGVAAQPGFAQGALPGRIGHPVGVAVSGTSLYFTLHNGVAVVRNRP